MRKPDSDNNKQSGNALIYVIIAIALIGFLTVTLSNQGEQADSQNIDDEQAELYALQLIEYAATAKSVIDQMEMTGTSFNDFDFINPTSSVPFNTAPHIHKVFHPQGGGLTYKDADSYSSAFYNLDHAAKGWNLINVTNVEWTPSTSTDIIFTFFDVNPEICAKINEKILGDSTIPEEDASIGISGYFREDYASNNLDDDRCTGCIGYPSLCMKNYSSEMYAFYNILLAR